MKALLTIEGRTGLSARVNVPERTPVLNFVGNIPTGQQLIDIGRIGDFSLFIKNDGTVADEENLTVDILDGDLVLLQRSIVYPQRAYILPVPRQGQTLRLSNSHILSAGIPTVATVF